MTSDNHTQDWSGAEELLASVAGWRRAAVVFAANRLDLFSALRDGPAAATAVAERLGSDPRATRLLLDALVGLELLEKSMAPPASSSGRPGEREPVYSLTEAARDALLPDAPHSITGSLRHQERLYARWAHIAEAVRHGRPVPQSGAERDEAQTREFVVAMADTAKRSAPRLLKLVDVSRRRRFLDLGGAPGVYAAAFCRAVPELRATVFDLPKAVAVARDYLQDVDVRDRIELEAGDLFDDPLPRGHDLALLSNVLHIFPEDAGAGLVRKVWEALQPGGQILVKDFRLEEDRTRPASAALFSINMLLATEGGRAYTLSEMTSWLDAAGFRDLAVHRLTERSVVLEGFKRE
ncbi:MAG: methyltransferase domain-containing protein [Candidatus Eisenbacteria bacterium]|nr:methyltransferase domain-containing protein [Candidatus Eisenbacteria bacterium]